MIPIVKSAPPEKLERKKQKAIADGCSDEQAYRRLKNPLKEQVRQQLMVDQGHLCAYCMCEIPRGDVPAKIPPVILEHFIARHPVSGVCQGLGLDYNNLFVVCHGNRGPKGQRRDDDLTCDAHRGNARLRKVDPCDPSSLRSIFYTLTGRIDASDPDVQYDLQETLNLNSPTSSLIAERKGALEGLIGDMGKVDGEDLLGYCTSCLQAFAEETDPKTPYVGVLIWYLTDMIKALTEG